MSQRRRLRARLVCTTAYGKIVIELFDDEAPVTVRHVRRVARELHGLPGSFYRAQRREHWVPGREFEVLQGGWPERGLDVAPVEHEPLTRPHEPGTVSLARGAPGTASTEFFICLDEHAPRALDLGAPAPMDGLGFAAFGIVVAGLDVARAIHRQDTTLEAPSPLVRGQWLKNPVEFVASLA